MPEHRSVPERWAKEYNEVRTNANLELSLKVILRSRKKCELYYEIAEGCLFGTRGAFVQDDRVCSKRHHHHIVCPCS